MVPKLKNLNKFNHRFSTQTVDQMASIHKVDPAIETFHFKSNKNKNKPKN
jgi:hypothetical protein